MLSCYFVVSTGCLLPAEEGTLYNDYRKTSVGSVNSVDLDC
jgi:hypothetical protein